MTLNELDKILKTRREVQPPEGLNTRILAAARHVPQERGLRGGVADFARGVARGAAQAAVGGVQALWVEIQTRFPMPQPALALAAVVVLAIGIMLGMQAEDSNMLNGLSVGDLATFMVIDDRFVAAEWV